MYRGSDGCCAVDVVTTSRLPPNDRPQAELSILDITKWFGETSGGVKTYLLEKARYVAARPRLRHVLIIPGPRDHITLGSGVRTYRLRGPLIPTQTAYRFLFATRSTRRIIEHERPGIIEVGSPFFVPWVTALARRRIGTPMVSFYHTSLAGGDPCIATERRSSRGVRQRVTASYLRLLHRLFRTTIVASDFAGDELRRLGIDNVTRVPLGVDLAHFHPDRRQQATDTRQRLGLPPDRPLVLYVGRLAREKRLDVLLEAWCEVERATGAHLVIVGSGSEERALRAHSRAVRVSWLPHQGDRENVARLHAAADIYISPGDAETFGLSALEALSSGTPVVSAARGGVAEQVQSSGAGVLYDPDSPEALTRAVVNVLGADLKSLGGRGRVYAEQEHGWATVFDRLFMVYREVLRT